MRLYHSCESSTVATPPQLAYCSFPNVQLGLVRCEAVPFGVQEILEHIFVISKLWGLRDDITECGEAITQVTLVNWHCNGPATQLLN